MIIPMMTVQVETVRRLRRAAVELVPGRQDDIQQKNDPPSTITSSIPWRDDTDPPSDQRRFELPNDLSGLSDL